MLWNFFEQEEFEPLRQIADESKLDMGTVRKASTAVAHVVAFERLADSPRTPVEAFNDYLEHPRNRSSKVVNALRKVQNEIQDQRKEASRYQADMIAWTIASHLPFDIFCYIDDHLQDPLKTINADGTINLKRERSFETPPTLAEVRRKEFELPHSMKSGLQTSATRPEGGKPQPTVRRRTMENADILPKKR